MFGRADCVTVQLTFRDGVHGVCDRSRITDVDVEWYKQAFQRPGAIAASINYYRCGCSGGGKGVQRKRGGREATHAVAERGRGTSWYRSRRNGNFPSQGPRGFPGEGIAVMVGNVTGALST